MSEEGEGGVGEGIVWRITNKFNRMNFYKHYKFDKDKEERIQQIKDNIFYFSKVNSFNDPFEWKYTMSAEKINLFDNDKHIWEFTKEGFKEYSNKIFDKWWVCVFSENSDEPLMWSHYANSHKWFCLEVEINTDDVLQKIGKVNYLEEYIDLSDESLSHKWDDFLTQILYSKDSRWDYENEWRIVLDDSGLHILGTDLKVKGIIFWVRMDTNDKKIIKNIMWNSVTYSQAELSDLEYKIDINPC